MNSYKMISAALMAGFMTACVITDGSTDSITGISASDSTAGSTGGTGSSGDASTGGSSGGTGSSGDVPTTDAPTSSSSGTGSTSSTSTSTSSTTGGGAMCGWDPGGMYYDCGFEGVDPGGTFPIECPADLVEGAACDQVPGEGCCDGSGDNWYCGDNGGMQILVKVPCGG